ncbi:ATP-binding cassette domain-containing protein [Streptomyces sp. NBC_00847]|uniref:ATP-binding cassette domain-containing protein n=1 Tax=unclassified Streptomyces TaxID=2593676 RepID=UPI00225B5FE7|nr:ATP-binding cassette domain-containing protein [Streptomyces sp. NBC_00847]MCX4879775.1 ATP-binding cassette domain-containing protein [Streptomyces sp. NBC_00847]
MPSPTPYTRPVGFTALDGVDLDVSPGQVTAVVGPNGAGKSTLFHCLAGTLRPTRGHVRLGDRDITRLTAQARTRLGIARTFQQLAVFPSLTVAENVRVGAEQGRVSDPGAVERALRLLTLDGPVRALPAAGLPTGTLRRVELGRAGTLSGGEQRMLALSRALLARARVVLVDEPAQGMSPPVAARTYDLLGALDACVVVAEQRLPPGLQGRKGVFVHELRRGAVVFSGEAGERERRSGAGRTPRGPDAPPRRGPSPSG